MTYIFDIDGTVADCEHRMHFIATKPKNYDAFYAGVVHDTPMVPMCRIVRELFDAGQKIVFCTGRPEKTRHDSAVWLSRFAYPVFNAIHVPIYMRPDNDFRRDDIVKSELLDRIIADGHEPKIVFDDRPRVCEMFKKRGLLVCRVGDKEHF